MDEGKGTASVVFWVLSASHRAREAAEMELPAPAIAFVLC